MSPTSESSRWENPFHQSHSYGTIEATEDCKPIPRNPSYHLAGNGDMRVFRKAIKTLPGSGCLIADLLAMELWQKVTVTLIMMPWSWHLLR